MNTKILEIEGLKYNIQENQIKKSQYLDNLTNGNFMESGFVVIKLDDIDVKTWEFLLSYMSETFDLTDKINSEYLSKLPTEELVTIYEFSNKFLLNDLSDFLYNKKIKHRLTTLFNKKSYNRLELILCNNILPINYSLFYRCSESNIEYNIDDKNFIHPLLDELSNYPLLLYTYLSGLFIYIQDIHIKSRDSIHSLSYIYESPYLYNTLVKLAENFGIDKEYIESNIVDDFEYLSHFRKITGDGYEQNHNTDKILYDNIVDTVDQDTDTDIDSNSDCDYSSDDNYTKEEGIYIIYENILGKITHPIEEGLIKNLILKYKDILKYQLDINYRVVDDDDLYSLVTSTILNNY